MLLDGKMVREEILNEVKKEIANNNMQIGLAIIYVGFYAPSEKYIKNKIKYCDMVGIKVQVFHLEEAQNEEEIITLIKELNNDDTITGIILQSPLPNGLDIDECTKYIDPNKDIDGFTKENLFKLVHNIPGLRPCTPKGIICLLEYYNIPLVGKKVCIIGRGNIVGKPLLHEFINKDATVTIAHSKTQNLKEITLASDIIVCAVGKAHMLTADMVKDGAIVIDVGVTIIDGKTMGDADFETLKEKCSYITPNPGGVGPMTIAMIIENLLYAYKEVRKHG